MHSQNDVLFGSANEGLDIFQRYDLDDTVVEMVRRFRGENRESALLERIFLLDADFELVWETQFERPTGSALQSRQHDALLAGLLSLFVPDPGSIGEAETYGELYERWCSVTERLIVLGERAGVKGPWLYGWLRFGVEIDEACGPYRSTIWDRVVSKSVHDHPISAQIGKIYIDLLPQTAEELLALPGVGPARLKRVEWKLVQILVSPEWARILRE